MKILLMGDASHYHATLAKGLRDKGHDVTLASAGSGWMNTPRDIDLTRPFRGKAGGAFLYARLGSLLRSRLKGYDIVQFAGPLFLSLLPRRNASVFRRLKRDNGALVLCDLATDTPYIDFCKRTDTPLRYNEWRVNHEPTEYALKDGLETDRIWHTAPLRELCEEVYSGVDAIATALYEYHLSARTFIPEKRTVYCGIPVDTDSLPDRSAENEGIINIFLGRHADRIAEKGTDILERCAREAVARSEGKAKLAIVENRPYQEYIRLLSKADIALDQTYSYSPATNALLSMSMGIPTVSGGEEEYYKFIGEEFCRPIINIDPRRPDSLVDTLLRLIGNPSMLSEIGEASREFAARHNSVEAVAARFEALYSDIAK